MSQPSVATVQRRSMNQVRALRALRSSVRLIVGDGEVDRCAALQRRDAVELPFGEYAIHDGADFE